MVNERKLYAFYINKLRYAAGYTTIIFGTSVSNEAVLCTPFQIVLTPSQPFVISYVTLCRVLLN